MNRDLFRSRHALHAALLVAAFAAWHVANPQPFGSRDTANETYLLATGWVALLLYVVVALYAVRKALHALGLSPELRFRQLPVQRLEQAQSALRGLQNRIAAREVIAKPAIARQARAIVRAHGLRSVLRVRIARDPGGPGYQLQVLPREPLGRLVRWMHVHLYWGLAAAVLVWFHGGVRVGSPLGLLLNLFSAVVILTGLLGIALWALGPTWVTRRERELSTEKAFALREHYRDKVSALARSLLASAGAGVAAPDRSRARADDEARAPAAAAVVPVPALQQLAAGGTLSPSQHHALLAAAGAAAGPARDLAVVLAQHDAVAHEHEQLAWLRSLLNAWRLVHVPCSIVLLALVAVHVITVWLY